MCRKWHFFYKSYHHHVFCSVCNLVIILISDCIEYKIKIQYIRFWLFVHWQPTQIATTGSWSETLEMVAVPSPLTVIFLLQFWMMSQYWPAGNPVWKCSLLREPIAKNPTLPLLKPKLHRFGCQLAIGCPEHWLANCNKDWLWSLWDEILRWLLVTLRWWVASELTAYLNHISDGVPPVFTDPPVSAVTLAPVWLVSWRPCVAIVEEIGWHDPFEAVILCQLKEIE